MSDSKEETIEEKLAATIPEEAKTKEAGAPHKRVNISLSKSAIDSATNLKRDFSDIGVNPFINDTDEFGIYEYFKLIVCGVTLFPIRVILLILCTILLWIVGRIATIGLSFDDLKTKPLSPTRRLLLTPGAYIARLILFVCGFYWINRHGTVSTKKEAAVITPNHISVIDAFYMLWMHTPVAVGKAAIGKAPIAGSIVSALQPVFVDRSDSNSKANTIKAIIDKANDPRYPQVLIFPEGTTTSGAGVLTFKRGGFMPGLPVQPVAIKYPHSNFNPAWVGKWQLSFIMFRLLCQFVNYMDVTYLPVYSPNVIEKKNNFIFANNVRKKIAKALNKPCTGHSFEDVVLQLEAAKMNLPPSSVVVEATNLKEHFTGVTMSGLKKELEAFAKIDTNKTGTVDKDEFAKALGIPKGELLDQVFARIDLDETGELDFREFVIMRAYVSKYLSNDDTLKLMFTSFDRNGDGLVDVKELEVGMRKAFPSFSNEDATRYFSSIDGVTDSLNFEQFSNHMKKHPEYLSLFVQYHLNPKEKKDQ